MISEERLQALIADTWGLTPESVARYWGAWRDERTLARAVEGEATAALAARLAEAEALLREAREDWIKVGYGASHEDVAACRDVCDRIDAALKETP
jgi:hypothetical protein